MSHLSLSKSIEDTAFQARTELRQAGRLYRKRYAQLGQPARGHASRNTAFEAFKSILSLSSINDITKTRHSKAKYNYPYIEADTFFPCQYHLETLAYTKAWRAPENIKLMTDALNHYNEITQHQTRYMSKSGTDITLRSR